MRNLHRIQRQEAARLELQGAQLVALTANLNRDPKKSKPFQLKDFVFFGRRDEEESGPLTPEVAAIAMQLRHEDKTPPLLLAAWQDVIKSLKEGVQAPTLRAFASEGGEVWVIAPRFEGRNCRGGLVLVRGRVSGDVVVRDIDRSLNSYKLQIPTRPGFGWIEANLLLLAAET